MEFSRALRLIRSSNARLTCLAVGLRPKASLPPKVWQLPSATAEQSDTTLHPVTEDNHPRGEPYARPGDLNQLCNWGQHCKLTMPKLVTVFHRGMNLFDSYRSFRKRSICKKQVTIRRQHHEGQYTATPRGSGNT
jgi:hypothetical protein